MPARKTTNGAARNSSGIRKPATPKRTAASRRHHIAVQIDNGKPDLTTDHPIEVTHQAQDGAPTPPVTPVTPVEDTDFPAFSPEILTIVRQKVRLPGWGVNGWKLFTTRYILRIVEVNSEAEAVAARLAAALESEKSYYGPVPATPEVDTSELVSLRIPGGRLNHREPVAMKML